MIPCSLPRRCLALFAVLLVLAVSAAPLQAQSSPALDSAVAYIRTQQQPDGSFAGFGPGSTADAVFALAAANQNVAEVRQGGQGAIDSIRAQAASVAKDTGVSAKFVIALLLAGQSPMLPGGPDLVQQVESGLNPATGQYGADVTSHAYAMVALRAAGKSPEDLAPAANALKQLQLPDGGWSFDGTAATGSDTNTTSLAIQALIAAGDRGEAVNKAASYLRAQQNADGGFPYSQSSQFGNSSDANSTALAIQAILALGEPLANWAREGQTPADRLRAFQNASGAFRYQDAMPDDNALATYQAVPALAGQTLPLEGITIAFPAPAEPTTPPSPAPVQLPNTGAGSLVPALAVVGMALLVAGTALVRHRAS